MKKLTALMLALVLILCLCACTQDGGPVTPHIMYEGKLYEIPVETTGVAFPEDAQFGDVVILAANTLPTADGECNIHAQQVQTYDEGDHFIVIVDGTQYSIQK